MLRASWRWSGSATSSAVNSSELITFGFEIGRLGCSAVVKYIGYI